MTDAHSKLAATAYGEGWQQVVDRLVIEKIASRIAAKDATVWGPEAEAESAIRLSWVDLYESSRPLLAEIEALQADLRAEGLDRIVLAGMGGSSLAPEVITRTAGVDLVVLDSTNPSVIARALAGDLQRTVLVVSSKSGGTVETDSQRRAFVKAFSDAGIDAASRIVVVTDPGSPFEKLAADEGYRKTFLADPHVGGRYSALTAFGLVPSALAGADVAELLDQAAEVAPALQADDAENPALVLAAVLAGSPGRDKAIIAAGGSSIVGFPDWAEQLIAESTGKNGTGVLPVAVQTLKAPELHSSAGDLVHALLAADTSSASVASGTPTVVTTGSLGAQLLLWETATAAAGYLLGINPFDQPDVESAKQAARGLLDAQPEPEAAAFTDGTVEVRGSEGLLDGVDSLQGALDTLLGKLDEDGYLAVMAYLDSERDENLVSIRPALATRTGRPVTFGWGPRFLHSTGQYHKGGHPQGVFLQITSSESTDVEIPDRPFSFGTLISAQAAGDANVLAERGRPVLRLHLTDPAAGVQQLISLLDAHDKSEASGR
ncbi:phosphoglucose isomerase (PGI) [Kribbella flavida DSM 17836]|uniref:Glucose-6-phosphate isomerase n=1 Tax=Kribbella flavida (strain DSM 17836 / JCM 10339 / NBRC 14399) TaxID=479435 RepID=D2Q4L7_KRIFD|nr:glucose-6-phosphate isomerase [Kribbella flavida]ADB32331.1 phosphoglucose isomerase (PGI) [Kribbella flavida DSM 17836]